MVPAQVLWSFSDAMNTALNLGVSLGSSMVALRRYWWRSTATLSSSSFTSTFCSRIVMPPPLRSLRHGI
jgi:hypothetical protein